MSQESEGTPQKQGKAAGRHATLPSRGSPRQETLAKRSNKCEQAGRRGKFRRERCIDPRPPSPPLPAAGTPYLGVPAAMATDAGDCIPPAPPPRVIPPPGPGSGKPGRPCDVTRSRGTPSRTAARRPSVDAALHIPAAALRSVDPEESFDSLFAFFLFFFCAPYISPPPSSLSLCLRRQRVFDASGYPKMAAGSRGERPAAAKTFFLQVPDITTRLPPSSPQEDALSKLGNTPAPDAVSVPSTRRLGARTTSSIPTKTLTGPASYLSVHSQTTAVPKSTAPTSCDRLV